MSEQAAEMIVLLREIRDGIKTLNERTRLTRSGEKLFSRNGDAGPKPCIECPMRVACKSACAEFDRWKFLTGFDRAKPGAPEKPIQLKAA